MRPVQVAGTHVCIPGAAAAPGGLHGAAITRIERWVRVADQTLRWWAHNNEYATAISVCPFCGLKLP